MGQKTRRIRQLLGWLLNADDLLGLLGRLSGAWVLGSAVGATAMSAYSEFFASYPSIGMGIIGGSVSLALWSVGALSRTIRLWKPKLAIEAGPSVFSRATIRVTNTGGKAVVRVNAELESAEGFEFPPIVHGSYPIPANSGSETAEIETHGEAIFGLVSVEQKDRKNDPPMAEVRLLQAGHSPIGTSHTDLLGSAAKIVFRVVASAGGRETWAQRFRWELIEIETRASNNSTRIDWTATLTAIEK